MQQKLQNDVKLTKSVIPPENKTKLCKIESKQEKKLTNYRKIGELDEKFQN